MAEEYQRVVDLPVKTSSGISLLSDYLMGIDSSDGYQMLINDLAKKIVEDYIGSSLGGTSRTLKTALDAISNQIGSTTMGTTATTLTGAIKEHNDKIGDSTMGTTASTLTGAIAEHEGDISGITDDVGDIDDFIGDTSMGTTATTITGAIAEHESDISTLNSKISTVSNVCQQIAAGTVNINYVRKSANIVVLSYELTECSIDGNNGTVCRLPENFRPSSSQYIEARCTYGGALALQRFYVDTDGYVKTSIGSNTVTNVYIMSKVIIL